MPNAIDLYSGVGGWSLGLRLAGMDVIASYEICDAANLTNRNNNKHTTYTVDIRQMALHQFCSPVDVIVGSPPCTQFSWSNRGGSGDLSDGLKDIRKFFSVVKELRPEKWAMENVPRLSKILETELRPGGLLEDFVDLGIRYDIFSMEHFGLPQQRKRCIVGNFDFDLLKSYAGRTKPTTLGDVVSALSGDPVMDPNFADTLPRRSLFDHDIEEDLNEEEKRINRAAKEYHPVYNRMRFPDLLSRPSRTITATCTRVSRESIIIESPEGSGRYRRLSVRERACAQGFPIGFQFFGKNHSSKLRMAGNAVPPLFAYYIGHAMLGTDAAGVQSPRELRTGTSPTQTPTLTRPHKAGVKFRPDRSFRFAIPHLRLGSGVRFELSNGKSGSAINWHVRFVYGSSKDICTINPDRTCIDQVLNMTLGEVNGRLQQILTTLDLYLSTVDVDHMQAVWSHSGPGLTRPFMLLDKLGEYASLLAGELETHIARDDNWFGMCVSELIGDDTPSRLRRLLCNGPLVVAGILVGALANARLATPTAPPIRRMPALTSTG